MKANGQKGGVGIGDTSVNIIISTQKEPSHLCTLCKMMRQV